MQTDPTHEHKVKYDMITPDSKDSTAIADMPTVDDPASHLCSKDDTNYLCSFCGKSRKEVKLLIKRSNDICICGECVIVCVEIIVDEAHKVFKKEGGSD